MTPVRFVPERTTVFLSRGGPLGRRSSVPVRLVHANILHPSVFLGWQFPTGGVGLLAARWTCLRTSLEGHPYPQDTV